MFEAAADRRSKRHSDSQNFWLPACLTFQRKRPGASPSTGRVAVGHYGIEDYALGSFLGLLCRQRSSARP